MIFRIHTPEGNKKTSGFTLVETLVAVTILLMVVVGPMSIASQGLRNAYFAGEQTTAIYLAQEAIEYIQKLRDDNALEEFVGPGSGDTSDWYDDVISDNCKGGDSCDIDFDTGDFVACGTAPFTPCRLNYYPTPVGVRSYGYETPSGNHIQSPYTRRIQVDDPVGASGSSIGGVPVTVTVTWYAGLFRSDRSVVLQTYIYDSYTRYE
jgi:type II secretory pathway pseudopilin PulG